MKKVMSIQKWEKSMAQWAQEPPGLTVKQIKKLVKKDSDKTILAGFTKPLFVGEGF
jgi:tripartite-type tricarboxylate transporter receptor subunit TctC